MMAEFIRWLTHQTLKNCEKDSPEQRQAQQILESSVRNVQRAEKSGAIQQQILNMATEDLKQSVHDTLEKMRAGERAVKAAASAVELLESQKRQE